ncbi:hypothetical protein HQ571_03080 [Candidatus Kuenenbacteria bacterium]|nr:hypothetical protein [Candidatus Kuenenbacteria bacterium]
MSSTDKSTGNLCFLSEYDRSHIEEKDQVTSPEEGVVLNFGIGIRIQGYKPRVEETSSQAEQVLDEYIESLRYKTDVKTWAGKKLVMPVISSKGIKVLRQAIKQLLLLFPIMDTIEMVRCEFDAKLLPGGAPKPLKRNIAEEERTLWETTRITGNRLIPGFDLDKALSHFTVPVDERKKRVFFLKPEHKIDMNTPAVPYEQAQAEVFFWLIVRMFRYQHEINSAERKKQRMLERRHQELVTLLTAKVNVPKEKNLLKRLLQEIITPFRRNWKISD